MEGLEDTLAAIPVWDTPARLAAINGHRKAHIAAGGHSTPHYTAATDLLVYQRIEALQDGDTTTAEHLGTLLYELHQGTAVEYAGRFTTWAGTKSGMSFVSKDLQAAANLGLWHAISTYRPGQGSFSSWAYRHLRGSVLRALQQTEHQTLSKTDLEQKPAIIDAMKRLTLKGEEPTTEQIQEYLSANGRQVTLPLIERVLEPTKLTKEPTHPDGSPAEAAHTHAESVEDVALGAVYNRQKAAELNTALDVLSERQRYILAAKYGFGGKPPEGNEQISRTLGISREAVRKAHEAAILKLRATLGEEAPV